MKRVALSNRKGGSGCGVMVGYFSSALLVGGLLMVAVAPARTIHINSHAGAHPDSPAAVLRSAFYLRASGRDCAAPSATSQELSGQLQRHFDLVLDELVANGDRGLDVALNRLQQSRGQRWTDEERTAWRQTLALRRALNIRRLRIYQVRGLFPQNEHTSSRAVPIFVDNYGTACAVGHLMRESGWGDAVAAIRRSNNFVYVTDVRDGPLFDWVLISGLTQEEAALIQPSYGPPPYDPPPFDTGLDLLTQGGSITKNGLRFDNFRFIAGKLAAPDSFPQVPPTTNQFDWGKFDVAVGEGVIQSSGSIDPVFDDWLYFGARSWGNQVYNTDDPWGVLYSYDVATINPGVRLVAASLKSSFVNYNIGPPGFESWIYAGGATEVPALAHLALDATVNGFGVRWLVDEDPASFAPQQKLTVVTAAKLEVQETFTSIVHSFQVVPEPATATLAIFALIGVNILRRPK